ncbi:AMP-binding protein [Candidatus Acetothermia bacterium]|nr:AMP-binding protein [Candidatus Acetothermia bacterium]
MNQKSPTLVELFERSAAQYPAKLAFRVSRQDGPGYDEISYGELKKKSDQLAASLRARGVKKGQKILIVSRPRSAWIISTLGISKAGGIVIPVDASWQPGEVQRVIQEAEAGGAIVDQNHIEHLKGVTTLKHVFCMDTGKELPALEELLVGEGLQKYDVRSDDLAFFMCTSGTTGNAKIVMIAHENMSPNIIVSLDRLLITEQDRAVTIAPWYHIFGLVTVFAMLYRGATMIYTDDFKNLEKYLRENEATILAAVPKLYHAMFNKIENRIQSKAITRLLYQYAPKIVGWQMKKRLTNGKLRFFLSGSAPLDVSVEKAFRKMGIGCIEGYGMTECSPVLTFSTHFNEKYGSVGPAISNVELRIDHPDADGVGEVVARGPNIMRGYYKNPEKTNEIIEPSGWLHTGDLGRLDEDGWLYLKGRKKNVIVLESGKNVYPEEVEAELSHIPYIEDVMIKGGTRDGIEVIKAFVYPKQDALTGKSPEEIKHLIWEAINAQGKNLAQYKRLLSISDLIILDQPLVKTSKLDIKRYLYDEDGHSTVGTK